ncbi:MAG: DUF2877 domain-containing protein [Clostridiales bacterium]|nr:DUF2877 domain-containing protein [Clostridiales bacterium]
MFERAVNLTFRVRGGERMLTLFAPGSPRVPDAIRLAEGWPPAAAVGDGAILDGRRLSISSGASLLFEQEAWDGRIPVQQGRPMAEAFAALCAGLRSGLNGLPASLCRQACEAVAAGDARRWLGLGPGLTPAFDDLCVGAMAARRALGDRRAFPLPDLSRTTEISARYLTLAAEGYFSEPLCDVVAALFGNGDLGRSVGRLASVGATSGADMLTGIRLAVCGLPAAASQAAGDAPPVSTGARPQGAAYRPSRSRLA